MLGPNYVDSVRGQGQMLELVSLFPDFGGDCSGQIVGPGPVRILWVENHSYSLAWNSKAHV